MKIQYIFFSLLFLAGIFYGCEEIEDPAEGLQTQDLFVQYAAGLPDSIVVNEGDSLEDYITLQAPISFENDLNATISLTGEAASLADILVAGEDLVEQTSDEVRLTIPFLPANGEDLVTDQTSISIKFLDDGEDDINETVTFILEGATGPDGLSLLGGRGELRKKITFIINNNPKVISSLPDLTLDQGFKMDTILNLGQLFSDPENQDLTYSASIEDDSIASVSVSGDTLFIEEGNYADIKKITVFATDEDGGNVGNTFELTVNNIAPVVLTPFTDLVYNKGFDADTILNVSSYFNDPGKAPLAIKATSKYDSIATTSVSGDTLFITEGKWRGVTEVTVTATDLNDAIIEDLFMITNN